MDIIEALNILDFNSITELNKETLRKKYRNTLKIYHPDNNNGDETKAKEIIKAYDILYKALKQIEEYEKILKATQRQSIISILPYEIVNDIYNGKVITLGKGEDIAEINKSEMLKNDIYIMFMWSAGISGNIQKEYTNIQRVNLMRTYDINFSVDVEDLSELEIEINIYGQKLKYKMIYEALKVIIRLDNGIVVKMSINKKLIKGDDTNG